MTDASAQLSAQVQTIWEPAKPEPVDVASLNVEERTELWELILNCIRPQLLRTNGFLPIWNLISWQAIFEMMEIKDPLSYMRYITAPIYIDPKINEDTHSIEILPVPKHLLAPKLFAKLFLARNGQIIGVTSKFHSTTGFETVASLASGSELFDSVLRHDPQRLMGVIEILLRKIDQTIEAKESQLNALTSSSIQLQGVLDRLTK